MVGAVSKLVRDKIPDIIRETGETPVTHKATGYDFMQALCRKLNEEIEEFFTAATDKHRMEELADVLEVVHALADQLGGVSRLEQVRLLKRAQRGGFDEGIIWEGSE